jgi:hypothetical protein
VSSGRILFLTTIEKALAVFRHLGRPTHAGVDGTRRTLSRIPHSYFRQRRSSALPSRGVLSPPKVRHVLRRLNCFRQSNLAFRKLIRRFDTTDLFSDLLCCNICVPFCGNLTRNDVTVESSEAEVQVTIHLPESRRSTVLNEMLQLVGIRCDKADGNVRAGAFSYVKFNRWRTAETLYRKRDGCSFGMCHRQPGTIYSKRRFRSSTNIKAG